MLGHRLLYLAALACCFFFNLAYGGWLSGILLFSLLLLPLLSLLLSLPAMLSFRLGIDGASAVTQGNSADVWMVGSSAFPLPPFLGKLTLRSCQTGEKTRYDLQKGLPTVHCGGYTVTAERIRVCDYLGLFTFPVFRRDTRLVLIRPTPQPMPEPPDLKHYIARTWRPKFGGGFSENHELRLYRPGDNLNQVHWKLSAKTGKLTIREPMEPQRGLALVTLDLSGTPEDLDRKLGRLSWLGTYLCAQGLSFELRALTGDGILSFSIAQAAALQSALDHLLRAPLSKEGSIRDRHYAASWQYHIGGAAHEDQ